MNRLLLIASLCACGGVDRDVAPFPPKPSARVASVATPATSSPATSAPAASSASSASSGVEMTFSGPPSGVFVQDHARMMPKAGDPIEVIVNDTGSGAKVRLRPTATTARTGKLTVTIARVMSPSRHLPTVAYRLTASPSARSDVAFVIGVAEPVAEQPGRLGEEAHDALEALAGSKIVGTVSDSGALRRRRVELKSALADAADQLPLSLNDVVGLLFPPYPVEPVGVGARWAARERTTLGGLDVIRNYDVRVVEIAKGTVRLRLHASHYALDASQTWPFVETHGLQLVWVQYESRATVELRRKLDSLLPSSAEVVIPESGALSVKGKPDRSAPARVDTSASATD